MKKARRHPTRPSTRRPAAAKRRQGAGELGWLDPAAGPQPHLADAILQGLRERGYTEGRNLLIERRFAHGDVNRLYDCAGELVRLNVDVILTRFDRMVEAFGGRGIYVTEPREIRPALEKALGSRDVYCINVVLDPAAYRRTGQVSMAI